MAWVRSQPIHLSLCTFVQVPNGFYVLMQIWNKVAGDEKKEVHRHIVVSAAQTEKIKQDFGGSLFSHKH